MRKFCWIVSDQQVHSTIELASCSIQSRAGPVRSFSFRSQLFDEQCYPQSTTVKSMPVNTRTSATADDTGTDSTQPGPLAIHSTF